MRDIRNSKAPHFSPARRFNNEHVYKQFIPGPGQYEPKDYQDGTYTLSKYKNACARRFGTAARLSMKHPSIDTPGPGSYRPPSDFGYLDLEKFSPMTAQSPRDTMNSSVMSKSRINQLDSINA